MAELVWDWGVTGRARHAGVFLLPDPGILPIAEAARLVDELPRSAGPLDNHLWAWKLTAGGQEIEVEA